MSAKHTPGPWRVVRTRIGTHISPGPSYASYACIVEPLGLQVYGKDWRFGVHDRPESEYINGNAALIAAAPELLAACQAVLSWNHATGGFCTREDDRDVLAPLLAAVAKAEGRS